MFLPALSEAIFCTGSDSPPITISSLAECSSLPPYFHCTLIKQHSVIFTLQSVFFNGYLKDMSVGNGIRGSYIVFVRLQCSGIGIE